MNVLPVPPVVAQNTALLPDGNVDPAHATDCGEAVLSSALHVLTGYNFSPGCIRQAMGNGEFDGRTTAHELANMFRAFGGKATEHYLEPSLAWDLCKHLRHFGRYAVPLGVWDGPELHWILSYQRGTDHIWSADSWPGKYVEFTRAQFDNMYRGQLVVLDYR